MSRRSEIGLWAGLVMLAALAGVAIAGVPQIGAGPEPLDVATLPNGEADESDGSAGGEVIVPTTTSTTTSSTTSTTTTSTVPEVRAPEEVSVLVANGTSVPGAAGRLSDTLAEDGHPTLTPTSTRAYETSEVWFTGDYGPEAAELAERLGIFPENVMLMPDDAELAVGSANVIVIVGPELAEEA